MSGFASVVVWSLLVLVPMFSGALRAEVPSGTGTTIEQATAALLDPQSELRRQEALRWDRIDAFYQALDRRLAWLNPQGSLSPAGAYLLNTLEHADADAIDNAGVHLAALRQLRALTLPSALDVVRMDLYLTDSALRYAEALHAVPTMTVGNEPAIVAQLVQAYQENRVEAYLAGLPPQHSSYRRLREALARYANIAARGGWPLIPSGGADSNGTQIVALRNHLHIEGDLPAVEVPVASKLRRQRMDPALVRALKSFQLRNGLRPTGKLDTASLAMLNVPVTKRIEQLRANMVRWRDLPRQLGDRYIMVNVTDYNVAIVEDNQPRFTLRAIVGRPDRPTPALTSEISSVVFNPTWHVPTKLASEDLVPKQHKDPSFFAKQRIRIFSGWGAKAVEIQPAKINWAQIDNTKFPYLLRQDPGPENSLGHIKFSFNNAYDVYLHDTPKRSLFMKTARALSSGCVRVDRPVKLAAYLLAEQRGGFWTEEKIKETIASGERKIVRLGKPMRIYLVYWTSWVDDAGAVNFRDDIYGLDGGVKSCVGGVCLTASRAAVH